MILLRVDITRGAISKRAHNRAMRATLRDVAFEWQDKMLPRHFTRSARRRYNYTPRTRKYKKSKARAASQGRPVRTDIGRVVPKKGGRVDLVYSGRLERMMKRRQIIRATNTRATIRMPAPSYITGRRNRRKKRYPNIPRELTATTQEEKDQLVDLADRRYNFHIVREAARTLTRKRIA